MKIFIISFKNKFKLTNQKNKKKSETDLVYSKQVRTGFTLIELLIVIAIIGLLSSVVLASLNTSPRS